MNLYINTGAATLNAAIVTSAADFTPLTRLPDLVFGDSEPVALYFLSAPGVYESWSGGATYTPSISIGSLGTSGSGAYFKTSAFTAVTNGWTGRLGLTTSALAGAINDYLAGRRGYTSAPFTLQVTVSNASGQPETYAKQSVSVGASVTAQTTADSTPVSFADYAMILASKVAAAASEAASAASATASALSASTAAAIVNGSFYLARANHTGTQLAATISDFATAAVSALSSALGLKANLASPALTGTPTAPTAAAGTNTTQLATTAFATAADAAAMAYNAPTAISAAGNTNLALAAAQLARVENVSVSAGSSAFVATLTVQSTNAVAGAEIEAVVSMPASFNPVIELRALTAGGTLLGFLTGNTVSRVWSCRFRYTGATWILAAFAQQRSASIDEVAFATGTRAQRDSLYSDGATSNRRVEWTLGAAGAVAGLPIRVHGRVYIPTSQASADAFLFQFSSNGTSGYNGANILSLRLPGNSNNLTLQQTGATASDFRRLEWLSTFLTTYAGQWLDWSVDLPGNSTASPVIRFGGIDVTANFTSTSGGTAPNWMPTTLDTTKFSAAFNWTAGRFDPPQLMLGNFTAAESQEWSQTGRLPPWCEFATGTVQTVANAARNSAFSAGATDFTGGPNTTISVAGGALAVSGTGAGNVYVSLASQYLTQPLRPGMRVRFRGTLSNVASIGTGINVTPPFGAGSFLLGTANGAFDVEATLGVVSGDPWLGFNFGPQSQTAATTFTIDDLLITIYAPVIKPIIQPILVLADRGENKIAGVITGHAPITDKRDWLIQATTSTNGNQQILAAAVFDAANRHRIGSWSINNAGTIKTISLGNASAGAQYLSAGTAGAGLSDVTLASRFAATLNLWVASNGVDVLQHTICGHRVD